MGLSRTEIELLIQAKNNAQAAFDQLTKQVNGVTASTQKSNQEQQKFGDNVRATGVAAGATGVAVGLLAERMARGLVGAFQDTIGEANKLDAGLIGLGATAKAFGTDAGAAQAAAKSLAADGLMNVGEAAAGLKNLLAGGFSLPEAIELMNRFKDSAAFGRQGSLAFGQAIVGATEGIKNGNSALVDNAGLTKNLSNILVEAGYSATDLSKVQGDLNIRTALYKGILKETAPQVGQTALYLETAAGKTAQFNSQVVIAQQNIGKVLQPALASLTSTLTPLVQTVAENADTFVRLGGIVATVVVPMAALKAVTALGLTPALTALTVTTQQLIGAMAVGGGIRTIGDFRAGIQLAGEAAGITTKSLGPLGTAAAVAGAAFVGWQLGRLIADLTGLDQKIADVVGKWTGAAQRLKGETFGAVADVLNKASIAAGRTITDYTEAIRINTAVAEIRVGVFDKSAKAQRAVIEAELFLGRITAEQANARRAALDDEQKAADIRAKRMKFTDAAAGAEKKFTDEVKATGYSVAELVKFLKTNEAGFDAYTKSVNLSDTTVKRLKDTLKTQEDQQKKGAEATKKAAEEQKKFATELEQTAGVIDATTLQKKLGDLQKLIDAAGTISTPALATAVRTLWPEFEALAEQAKAAGFTTDLVDAAFKRAAVSAGVLVQGTRDLRNLNLQIPGTVAPVNGALVAQAQAAEQVNRAYTFFGQNTPEQLRKAATEAERNFTLLKSSGTASTQQLKDAYQQMITAQRAATGALPTYWEKEVFPGIKRTVETLQAAVQGSFAQMLLGAKSFGEGFTDIWKSIKASVLNILNEILGSFVNSFLKGILGAMSGQQGAFGKAFAGVFGGVGGGGFGIPGLGGLLGGGGGAAQIGTNIGIPGIPGAAGGAGGGFGAFATSGLGGSLIGGGAGLGVGYLLSRKFGRGAGIAGGVGAGALTGLALGGPIGAGVGALAGLVGGLLGGGNDTKKAREQFIQQQFGLRSQDDLFRLLEQKLEPDVAAAFRDTALNKIGKKDDKANQKWMADVVTALETASAKERDLAKAAKEAADAQAANRDASLKRLEDINGKIADLDQDLAKLDATEAVEEHMGLVEQAARKEIADKKRVLEEQKKAEQEKLDAAQVAADEAAKAYEEAAKKAQAAWNQFTWPTPPGARPGPTVPPDDLPPPVEGQAANGVMANRPGLVVFGEGGETEVGGPARFFKRIFDQLGVGGGGGGGREVVLQVDGMTFGRLFLPYIAQAAQDLGLVPSS